ncbi:MAG: hypothetical protein M0R51_13965 [Clostridia bacterium]|jgi:hypothetical protein|nr:hypothetical protein [Clostridia bacterium]
MGTPLVETLDKIEKKSAKLNHETAHYITHDGKVIFSVTGKKAEVTPSKKQQTKLKQLGNKVIITHNHPYPYNSSLTSEDMKVAIYNDSDGVRAITNKYTYVAYRPKKGWGISYSEFDKIYNDCEKIITRNMDNAYKKGTLTSREYKDLFTHEIMDKCCKKLNIRYFRFKN